MTQPSADRPCTALVVGAGPVGLTMAAHLHHHGLSCRIIDRSPTPSDKSKALVLWARSLEMFDNLGIVEPFLAAGMFLNAARFHGNGRLLVRIPIHPAGTEYPRPLMLAQSETERLLGEHLQAVGVPVERSVELTDFTVHGDHVTATLHHSAGPDEQVRCEWLLGCDGAHSTVRKKLSLEFTGSAEPNDWVLADVRLEGSIPHDEMSLFMHAKGVLVFFPFGTDRYRIVGDMGPARGTGRPADPSLAEVQALVDERGPGGIQVMDPVWLSGFRINERKVGTYSRGRVFLAGDAAHIHSPAGGQGMNTGMQDACNLAWKIALVQAGRARPSPLLDSYSQERSAVGEMVLRQAARMTWGATLRNPVVQLLRNRLVGWMGRLPAFQRGFTSYLSELAVHYPHSPLNGESTGAGWLAGSVRPGDRVPDIRLRSQETGQEQRLLAILRGCQHNLLLLPTAADAATLTSLRDICQRVEQTYPGLIRTHLIFPADAGLSSAWLDPTGAVRKTFGARETALALVRPDGYLGYRSQPASWEGLRGYLDRYLMAR